MSSSAPKSAVAGRADRVGCRFCGKPLEHTFVDLGTSPLCQRHVTPADFDKPEPTWPLHVYVCDDCHLVQLPSYVPADEIFTADYAYFSSYSDTWLAHAKRYAETMTQRLSLGPSSKVIEVASNDGYLLQYFVALGVPVLGIEPTANTAAAARQKNIPTEEVFLGLETATGIVARHGPADLVCGNNVLAHVPDLNDFVSGLATLLKPDGVLTMEFPHLARLIAENQFDTIYHEHYSYFWFTTVERVFAAHGVRLFDVEQLPTHGGSLRIYGRRADSAAHPVTPRVAELKRAELHAGYGSLDAAAAFAERVKETKRKLLEFLIGAKRAGKRVAGYGAPGKGNTLLNYCGIRTDFIDFTVDRNPHKQGNYLPGSRIPILAPDAIRRHKPDYLLILPWNLRDEIIRQTSYIREWGGRWVVPIPEVTVHE
jgi:SAM-dependent methyltransferase